MTSWSFLTNHRRTLLCTARHRRAAAFGGRGWRPAAPGRGRSAVSSSQRTQD